MRIQTARFAQAPQTATVAPRHETRNGPTLPAAPLLASAALLSGCAGDADAAAITAFSYGIVVSCIAFLNWTMCAEERSRFGNVSAPALMAAFLANTALVSAAAYHEQYLRSLCGEGWLIAGGVASVIAGIASPQIAYYFGTALPAALRDKKEEWARTRTERKRRAETARKEEVARQTDITPKNGFTALDGLRTGADDMRAVLLANLDPARFKSVTAQLSPAELTALGRRVDDALTVLNANHVGEAAFADTLEGVRRIAAALDNQDLFQWVIATQGLAARAESLGVKAARSLHALHAEIFVRSKGKRRGVILDALLGRIEKAEKAVKGIFGLPENHLNAFLRLLENLAPLMDATEKKKFAAVLAAFSEREGAKRLLPMLLNESDLATGGASAEYIRAALAANDMTLPDDTLTSDEALERATPAEFYERIFPAVFDSANRDKWLLFQAQWIPLLLTRRELIDITLDGLVSGLGHPNYEARHFAARTLNAIAAEGGLLGKTQREELLRRVNELEETARPELKPQTRQLARELAAAAAAKTAAGQTVSR